MFWATGACKGNWRIVRGGSLFLCALYCERVCKFGGRRDNFLFLREGLSSGSYLITKLLLSARKPFIVSGGDVVLCLVVFFYFLSGLVKVFLGGLI